MGTLGDRDGRFPPSVGANPDTRRMVKFDLDAATRSRVLDAIDRAFHHDPLFWDPKLESAGAELISRFQLRDPRGGTQIFSKAADEALRAVVSMIHSALDSTLVSWSTVANALRDQLDGVLVDVEKFDLDAALDGVLRHAGDEVVPRTVFIPILGLALPTGRSMTGAGWRLVTFSDEDAKQVNSATRAESPFAKHLADEVASHFLGRPCLIVDAVCDGPTAEKRAQETMRRLVAVLRFLACAHADGARHPRRPRVYAGPVRHHSAARMITLGGAGGPSRRRGPYGPSDEPYAPSAEHLDSLESIGAGAQLYELVGRDPKTDLERALLQAVLWIGDAEDEDNEAAAFQKYWTAVEALVSSHASQHKSLRLSTVIPIILACGDVRWISCTEIVATGKAVKKSYALRGVVVHQGDYARLRVDSVREVCRWAHRVATGYAHLAARGYTTTARCEAEAQLIWEGHQGPPSWKTPRLRTGRRPGVGALWTALYSWMGSAAEIQCDRSLPSWFVEGGLIASLKRSLAAAGARVTQPDPAVDRRRPRRADSSTFEAKLDGHRYAFSCKTRRVTLRTRRDVGRVVPPVGVAETVEVTNDGRSHDVRAIFTIVDRMPTPEMGDAAACLDAGSAHALIWVPRGGSSPGPSGDEEVRLRVGLLLSLDMTARDPNRSGGSTS